MWYQHMRTESFEVLTFWLVSPRNWPRRVRFRFRFSSVSFSKPTETDRHVGEKTKNRPSHSRFRFVFGFFSGHNPGRHMIPTHGHWILSHIVFLAGFTEKPNEKCSVFRFRFFLFTKYNTETDGQFGEKPKPTYLVGHFHFQITTTLTVTHI